MTERNLDVLQAIHDLLLELGWPPSLQEIGDHLGLTSRATVLAHLDTLERHHLIARGARYSPRALRITPLGEEALTRRVNCYIAPAPPANHPHPA